MLIFIITDFVPVVVLALLQSGKDKPLDKVTVNVMHTVVLLNCLYKSSEREEYNNDKKTHKVYSELSWNWMQLYYD